MTKKNKKVFDPTKPLPNPKHEIMARKLAEGSSQVEAYRTAYPKAKKTSVEAAASRSIAYHNINDRALKLLESVGLSETKLASKLNECVDSDNESIKLDGVKTGFKLLGYGADQRQAETSYNPVQINIVIQDDKTQDDVQQDVTDEPQ